MEEMKLNVLKKALGMLDVLGCTYAVVDPAGTKHGSLEVTPPKKKRTFSGIAYKPMFYEQVKAITPSDTIHEFTPPEGVDFESYRGSLCGWCSTNWGRDTYSSQVKDGKILLMRYA